MERAGFFLSLGAGFFTVFLLGWRGYHGVSADWIYGFLAAFWSLIMMLRLMTLTAPAEEVGGQSGLAQKLLGNFRERQEEDRQVILENAFGGSFLLFLIAGFAFAAWQAFCAAFPAQQSTFDVFGMMVRDFFGADAARPLVTEGRIFDWGQGFLLLLSLSMMGFVLRSHAARRGYTRPALIVLCAYALAGYVAFTGLESDTAAVLTQADFTGNGAGAASFFLGDFFRGKTASLFDVILLESGIVGLAILTFILFVPLGYITLAAQANGADRLIVCCGVLAGSTLILSVFLPLTPALGGLVALCWMALFLAWGGAENSFATNS